MEETQDRTRNERQVPTSVPRSRLGAVLVAAVLGAGLSRSSLAAPAGDAERRLEDRWFFVQSLERGYEPFVADVDRTAETMREGPPEEVRRIRGMGDMARETLAKRWLLTPGEEGETRALAIYGHLGEHAVDESRHAEFRKAAADIEMTQAERAEEARDEPRAFELAKSAAKRSPGHPRATAMIGRLGMKEGIRFVEAEDYEAALEVFRVTDENLAAARAPAGAGPRADVAREIEKINAGTGVVTVKWLGSEEVFRALKGPKTDFTAAALRLQPHTATGREPPPVSADKPRRVRTGSYRVSASGTGGDAKFEASLQVDRNGGTVTLPRAIPDGMVFVQAAGGGEAFLIDAMEVSNAQWQAAMGAPRGSDPRLPATNVTFADAQRYCAATGKRLPTLEQWSHAAFGSPNAASPRYPWGDQAPVPGTHFVGGTGEPGPVDSCPQGRSRTSGCLNMAGNVWEWLANGWLIGGGHALARLEFPIQAAPGSDLAPWTADFLRQPIPSMDVWTRDLQSDARYYHYHATDEKTLPQAGLRCVVPLGGTGR